MAAARKHLPDVPDLDVDEVLRREVLAEELRSHYDRP
jgi:hypothetical protein